MIENRNLTAGTRLVATYKKQAFVCMVEAGEDGKLAFVLEDGKRYTSPSHGLEEGQQRWFCAACQNSFIGTEAYPEVCAEGHRADDPELTAAAAT